MIDLTQFQMVNRYERIQSVTDAEADRRIAIVREVMKEHDLQLTLFFNLLDSGMAWWLISCSSKIPDCVMVPMEGPVTAIYYSMTPSPTGGFQSRITPGRTPVINDLNGKVTLRNCFDTELASRCCQGTKRIGLVHGEYMDLHTRNALRSVISEYDTVELFQEIERRKCIKSPLEMELCNASAQMHTAVLQAVPGILRRGRTVREVASELHCLAMDLGSTGEDMCLMIHPMDANGETIPTTDDYPGYHFKDGDLVSILLETSGPGGMFTANARYWSFGEPSSEFMKRWEVAVAANDMVGALLKPGISLKQVAEQVNQFILDQGYYTDDCCYLHGMAYTMGEAPIKADHTAGELTNWSEDMPMQVHMQTLAHPHVGFANHEFTPRDSMVRCIDTYYITPQGSKRATTASRDIYIL